MTEPVLVFPWKSDNDLNFLLNREWLVTNGLGGYASGTLLGVSSRRHHGTFVPNLAAPKGRYIMISRFDEKIEVNGRSVRFGGAEQHGARLDTDTHRYLKEFRLDHRIAT